MECALKIFHSFPSPGLLPGIKITADKIQLEDRFFLCCNKTGICYDGEKNATVVCSLAARLSRIRNILSQFTKLWPFDPELIKPLPEKDHSRIHSALYSIFQGHKDISLQFEKTNAFKPHLLLWQTALIATWTYGLDTLIIALGQTSHTVSLLNQTLHQKKPLVLIDQARPFPQLDLEDELDYIKGVCYNACVPIWMASQRKDKELDKYESALFKDRMRAIRAKLQK